MSQIIKVRIAIPMTAQWVADVWVPSDRLDDISGFLSDDPEALELVQQNGWMDNDQLHLIDAQIEG